MFFKLPVIAALSLTSPATARLGEGQDVEAEGSPQTFNGEEISDLITNELSQEHWIPKKNFHKKSPYDFYSEDDLFEIPGVEYTAAGSDNVFDMSDRLTQVGYRITSEESGGIINNYADFIAWAGANLFPPGRYNLLPRPSLQSSFHWLSSPGLKAGDFRVDTLGAVTPLPFKEAARPVKSLVTRCPTEGLPLISYVQIVGNRYTKIPAGSTVWQLKDSFDNTYFLGALRGVVDGFELPNDAAKLAVLNGFFTQLNLVDNGAWTFGQRTLTEDFELSCLHSKKVPKNKKGEDGIVCKQVQLFAGPSFTSFALAEIATKNNGHNKGFPDLVSFNPNTGVCTPDTLFVESV